MKKKVNIVRKYVKVVEVEVECGEKENPVEKAYDMLLYTTEIEELFKASKLVEVDDTVVEYSPQSLYQTVSENVSNVA